jgi:ubiquinone/menaquinone biosynthesis C-methylase UbiE
MSAPFKPKQALDFDGALLQELQGDISDVIASHLLKQLPPLTSSSVVHDNGCGYGAVTMAIMATDPPPPVGVQIHATDVNPMFLTQLNAKLAVQAPAWPVTVATMDAKALTFPDDTFDLSITNFVIVALNENDGDVPAAQHILRTLKPGGTGAITVWSDMPWQIALINAHHKTRGTDEPMAPFLSKGWYKKEKLAQVMKDAGWKDVQFSQEEAYAKLGTDMRRWATIAWTFLGTPVGGWQQRDEDKWEEALDSIVEELRQSEALKVEDGVHKIRMIADIAIAKK